MYLTAQVSAYDRCDGVNSVADFACQASGSASVVLNDSFFDRIKENHVVPLVVLLAAVISVRTLFMLKRDCKRVSIPQAALRLYG